MFGTDSTTPADPKTMPEGKAITPDSNKMDPHVESRHKALIQTLRDEAELQSEERMQMAIDHDYQDHLHWTHEDAQELMDRGQAPLVFNEGRQTVEWICGTQKRMRMDEQVLPREEKDQPSAEVKSKVFKYVSDANLSQWHESQAFEEMVIGGLGWLEEGINTDPGATLIYSGSESWRNIYRDSRSRQFDIKDMRYIHRKKRLDLDYALALLPHAKDHLYQHSNREGDVRGDDVWYLGERLTGSTDLSGNNGYLPSQFRGRGAYIGGAEAKDEGRRLSLDLIESWYRVPEAVKVFSDGPLRGKEFDPKNEGHQQLSRDRWTMYGAVSQRMRVMISTEDAPLWDGKSPLRHQNFIFVPVGGYRRGRDGMYYGVWRGMRDLNDDMNKRASKALHAASSNRMVFKDGSVKDLEVARAEAARPDMMLAVKNMDDVRFEKPLADMKANMELLTFDQAMIRNVGGVTDANLGRESGASSGKAIGLQQDQGSLTTSKLPDNLRLAKQMAGRLRLSHIEQFLTQEQVFRIVGDGQPIEWVTVNAQQPDGTILNDIANSECDYIIGERDYRETYAQAALEQMMELLGQVAGYAPQVVMNVLDLVVDSAEIKNKTEWVTRIRKLNGQRDPAKAPTPEEIAAQQEGEAKAKRAEEIQLDTLQAGLDKLRAEVSKLDTGSMLQRIESMFSALQAAQIVAVTPAVAPIADTIAQGAGFVDQGGQDPNLPQPAAPVMPEMPQPVAQMPTETGMEPAMTPQVAPDSATGLEGIQSGIETPTGADNAPTI